MSDTPEWDDVVEQLARPRIWKLEAEIERLEKDLREVRVWAKQDINRLTAEIEQLRAALTFYAEADDYDVLLKDNGKTARRALEEKT